MPNKAKWPEDLIVLAEWALRKEDLRHQFLYAPNAKDIKSSPGIYRSIETTIVLAIYEAGLAKGFIAEKTIDYERKYPSTKKKKGNQKRADLAFKDKGKGKNWGFVEVKRYRGSGAANIRKDIDKLRERVKIKAQRWVLVYRVKKIGGNAKSLIELLRKNNFKKLIDVRYDTSFDTNYSNNVKGLCELCMAKLK